MARSNWLTGAALVLVVLLVALTFDPLGFFQEQDEGIRTTYEEDVEDLRDAGLKGRGVAPLPDADPKEWEGEPVGRLVLALGEATLEGSVTGGGQPLRFARVRPVLPPPNHAVAVRTRKDGTYEIRGLPAGQHEVRAAASGYLGRTTVAPAVAAQEEATVETLDLRRVPERTDAIVVHVTDAFGRPIPGAKVLATTARWDIHLTMGPELAGIQDTFHASGTTDERGRVRLGPLEPEHYNVVAQAKGYVPTGLYSVVVSSGRERHVGLRLPEGLSVSGRVIERATGDPVAGAMVMGMAVPAFASSLSTSTADDGTFTLDGLRKSGYMFFAWDEKLGETQAQGACPGPPLLLKLEGTGRVEGRAVWEDGTPVETGQVRPYQGAPFRYVYSMVFPIAEDGTFAIDLPKGKWTFRVQSADGHLAPEVTAEVTVGQTTELAVEVPKTGIVRGVVMDTDGNHIPGAEVFVMKGGFPESPSREQYARTDAEGAFEVPGLPLENVILYVEHANYGDQKINVMPALASSSKEVSVRLSRGATIRGTVTTAQGTAIAGEQVNLFQNFLDPRTTHTDSDGRYAFDAVAAGTWNLTTGIFEQGAGGLSKGGVNVGTEGIVEVNFQYPALGGKFTGQVVQAGQGVAGAQVRVQDARGPEMATRVRADDSGRFTVEGVQFGSLWVVAESPDGKTGDARARLEESAAPPHVVVNIGTAGLRVRAVDSDGLPVPGAWVNVELTEGAEGWSRVKDNGQTDTEGVFVSDGLEAGRYVVRITHTTYAQAMSAPFQVAAGETKDVGDVRMPKGAVVSGRVKNDAGQPVEKVTIGLRDAQGRPVHLFSMATTGSDGRYELVGVEPGRYTITFEAQGHARDEKSLQITATGATADGVLTRGGTIEVLVEDEGGHPVSGVRIVIVDAAGQPVTKTISLANFDSGRRTTGRDGRTQLADLAQGQYVVRCEKSGFAAASEPRAYVTPGQTASVRVVLQPLR